MNTELFAEAHQAKASHRINEGLRFFRAFRVRKKREFDDLLQLDELQRIK